MKRNFKNTKRGNKKNMENIYKDMFYSKKQN